MMDDWKLAWRNVWRNTRRTVVTIAAAALALATIIFYTGLVTGYLENLEDTITELEVGDAQVLPIGYRESPALTKHLPFDDDTVAKLAKLDVKASPRLMATGLGASADSSAPISLYGLDVKADAEVGRIHERIGEGTWLDPGSQQVVLGSRLAEQLGVEVGDSLKVRSQADDGTPVEIDLEVRGILQSVSDRVDRTGVFMSESAFRDNMRFDGGAHLLILRFPDTADLTAKRDEVAKLFDLENVEVLSWKEITPSMASMLESAEGAMLVMMGIVYIAVAIVVLNAMLMAVFERTKEFGILKAIGYGPGKVLRLILFETAIQAALAVTAGVLIAIPINVYMVNTGLDLTSAGNLSVGGLAFDPIWKSQVTLETYTTPAVSLLFIIGFAVIYPALRAAFIQPLDALRD